MKLPEPIRFGEFDFREELFFVFFIVVFAKREAVIDFGIDFSQRLRKFVVPFRGEGKDGIFFADVDGQFIGVGVQNDCRDILDRELAFNETELRNVVFVCYDVLRFDQQGNEDRQAK